MTTWRRGAEVGDRRSEVGVATCDFSFCTSDVASPLNPEPGTLNPAAASRCTSATISSTDRSSPSGSHEVYGVSQNQQRRLQPLVRTKTLGVPVSKPSPWSEE